MCHRYINMVNHLPRKRVKSFVAVRGSRTHSRKVSTHTRAPNEWNRGMGDRMEAQATDVPNKSYVRLGHVNARLRRRRSISHTPHILVYDFELHVDDKHARTDYSLCPRIDWEQNRTFNGVQYSFKWPLNLKEWRK